MAKEIKAHKANELTPTLITIGITDGEVIYYQDLNFNQYQDLLKLGIPPKNEGMIYGSEEIFRRLPNAQEANIYELLEKDTEKYGVETHEALAELKQMGGFVAI